MNIRLPDNYDPQKIAQEISRVLQTLEDLAKDKIVPEATNLGAEPANIEERKIHLYTNNSGARKLFIRHENRNYSVALTEET